MGTPAAYLPPALSTTAINDLCKFLDIPQPQTVKTLKVAAEYHSIYLLGFDAASAVAIRLPPLTPSGLEADGSATLVLRVSGRHLPRLKTRNEVAVMRWVRARTGIIPVPAVVRSDCGHDNPLGYEFTLLERAPGVSVDSVYDTLSEAQKRRLVEQLVGFVLELHGPLAWESPCVSGMVVNDEDDDDGGIGGAAGVPIPGPPVEETFWQQPDIEKYWEGSGETVESLNPVGEGAFDGYTSYIAACIKVYIYAIERHQSLAPFRDMVPRLKAFADVICRPENATGLNDAVYVLAHKDLHFGNIMCEPPKKADDDDIRITAILDWEFSGIVPANRWNPVRAFLWNCQRDDSSKEDQSKLEKLFEDIISEKAPHFLEDVKPKGNQGAMQAVQSYVRAIVEVCPRGQCADKVDSWRVVAEENMAIFGV